MADDKKIPWWERIDELEIPDKNWRPWWEDCPQKAFFSEAPNFSGLNPETLLPWSPQEVVDHLGFRAINDPEELRAICEEVVLAAPKQVEAYRAGKTKLLGFFFKQVLDATKNGANTDITNRILADLLRRPED